MTDVVLTSEGWALLQDELRDLHERRRPEVAARLRQALDIPGDLGDNAEYLDASAELARVDERIDVLEYRLRTARLLRSDEVSVSLRAVALGSRVELEDLDDGSCEVYVLVSSAESNPSAGRLSNESPVGRAIEGHHRGDVVEAHVPHGIRHLRIAGIADERRAA